MAEERRVVRQEASHPDTSQFAEDEAEIVCRHVDDLAKSESVASGDIDRLSDLVEELRIDSEDVILSGEYESRGGKLVKVRDLDEPLGDA